MYLDRHKSGLPPISGYDPLAKRSGEGGIRCASFGWLAAPAVSNPGLTACGFSSHMYLDRHKPGLPPISGYDPLAKRSGEGGIRCASFGWLAAPAVSNPGLTACGFSSHMYLDRHKPGLPPISGYDPLAKRSGEGGIRTHGRDKPYTAFPRLLDKPLRHLSGAYILISPPGASGQDLVHTAVGQQMTDTINPAYRCNQRNDRSVHRAPRQR